MLIPYPKWPTPLTSERSSRSATLHAPRIRHPLKEGGHASRDELLTDRETCSGRVERMFQYASHQDPDGECELIRLIPGDYSFLGLHSPSTTFLVANLGCEHPEETSKLPMTVKTIFNDPAHINMFCDSSMLLDEKVQHFLPLRHLPIVGRHGTQFPSLSCYATHWNEGRRRSNCD